MNQSIATKDLPALEAAGLKMRYPETWRDQIKRIGGIRFIRSIFNLRIHRRRFLDDLIETHFLNGNLIGFEDGIKTGRIAEKKISAQVVAKLIKQRRREQIIFNRHYGKMLEENARLATLIEPIDLKRIRTIPIGDLLMEDLPLFLKHIPQADEFEQYDRDHPDIWREFKMFAFSLIDKGVEHYGARAIFEVIRFHKTIATGNDDHFKANNSFTAHYARKFAKEYPKHKDFFDTRKAKADN